MLKCLKCAISSLLTIKFCNTKFASTLLIFFIVKHKNKLIVITNHEDNDDSRNSHSRIFSKNVFSSVIMMEVCVVSILFNFMKYLNS